MREAARRGAFPGIGNCPTLSSIEAVKSRSIDEPGLAFSKDASQPVQHLRLEPWLRYYVATHSPRDRPFNFTAEERLDPDVLQKSSSSSADR